MKFEVSYVMATCDIITIYFVDKAGLINSDNVTDAKEDRIDPEASI